RTFAVIDDRHVVACAPQRRRERAPHELVVVDDENARLARGLRIARRRRRLWFLRMAALQAREHDAEDGASFWAIAHRDLAAEVTDDIAADEKPETGAFAEGLGREKG